MKVLRGWRLLQAASLSPEEMRDILSTTQNKMDFESISQALQSLWDEQLLGHRYPSWTSSTSYANWHEWQDEWPSDSFEENYDPNYEHYNAEWWPSDEVWEEDWPEPQEPESINVAEDDDQLQKAQQAEQAAEQLALEAKRTWAQAQKTTQQLRKDRGFHQANAMVKCFNCGGSHFARDCPDRRYPSFPGSKGSAKSKSSYNVEQLHGMFQSKGKGKKGFSKSKSKFGHLVDQHDAFWTASRGTGTARVSPQGRLYVLLSMSMPWTMIWVVLRWRPWKSQVRLFMLLFVNQIQRVPDLPIRKAC